MQIRKNCCVNEIKAIVVVRSFGLLQIESATKADNKKCLHLFGRLRQIKEKPCME